MSFYCCQMARSLLVLLFLEDSGSAAVSMLPFFWLLMFYWYDSILSHPIHCPFFEENNWTATKYHFYLWFQSYLCFLSVVSRQGREDPCSSSCPTWVRAFLPHQGFSILRLTSVPPLSPSGELQEAKLLVSKQDEGSSCNCPIRDMTLPYLETDNLATCCSIAADRNHVTARSGSKDFYYPWHSKQYAHQHVGVIWPWPQPYSADGWILCFHECVLQFRSSARREFTACLTSSRQACVLSRGIGCLIAHLPKAVLRNAVKRKGGWSFRALCMQ